MREIYVAEDVREEIEHPNQEEEPLYSSNGSEPVSILNCTTPACLEPGRTSKLRIMQHEARLRRAQKRRNKEMEDANQNQ